MMVIRKGSRLSVQPVTKAEYDIVVKLGKRAKPHRLTYAIRVVS